MEQKLQGLDEEIKRKGEKTNKLQSSLITNEEYDELKIRAIKKVKELEQNKKRHVPV